MTDQAINTFVQIAIRTPEDPLPYVELGKTYFEVRDDDAAQEYLDAGRLPGVQRLPPPYI